MKYLRRQTLNSGNVFDDTILQRPDGNIELNPTQRVIINGDLVLGSNGSVPGPEVTNVMYVTLDGHDSNTGFGEGPGQAKRTLKAACEAAQQGTTIFIRSGEYYEDNPIKVPPKVGIIGDTLRNVILKPLNKTITYEISLIERTDDIVTITTSTTHRFILHDRARVECESNVSINEDSANIIELTDTTIKYRNVGPDFVAQGATGVVQQGFDYFLVNSSNYIANLVFKALPAPAYCINIDKDAIVDTSPYVQNCSNINGPWMRNGEEWLPFQTKQPDLTGTFVAGPRPLLDNEIDPTQVDQYGIYVRGAGGGMLIDGDRYNSESPIKSMVADAFTQVAQGAVGFHITNMGYMQLVSCFAVFCDKAFLTTKGGYLSISNSVIDFGNTGFTADGYFYQPYATGVVARDYFSTVSSVTVNIDGAGYTVAPDVIIDPPGTPGGTTATAVATLDEFRGTVSAITIIDAGSGYISVPNVIVTGGGAPSITAVATANLQTNAFIEVSELGDKPQVASVMFLGDDTEGYYISNTQNSTQSFRYNEQKCKRDVGYIVDAVLSDVAFNTNHQSVYAGISYLRSYSSKVLSLQKSQTIDGVTEAKNEVLARVTDPDALISIADNFDIVLNILENGLSGVNAIFLPELPGRESGFHEAKNILLANKQFIKDEIIAWISENIKGFEYDEAKCRRDVGLIVNAVLDDMILGTTYNSVFAGLSYLRSYSSTVISSQKKQTIAGINRARDIILGLVIDYNTDLIIRNNFKIITDIIQRGIPAAPQITYTNPVGISGGAANSATQLRVNKNFIAEEITAYINVFLNPTAIPNYNENVWKRDVKNLIDALIFDLLYNGNSATVNTALSYYIGTSSIIEGAELAFAATYQRLQDVIGFVIAADTFGWTRTPGNPLVQNVSNPPGDSLSTDTVVDLIEIVIDVVQSGVGAAPVIASPTYSAGAYYAVKNDDRLSVLSYLSTIQSDVIEFLDKTYQGNFTYNEAICRRDIDYILDAIAYDLTYGGDTQTTNAALAYAEGSVLAGELEETIEAYKHWKDIIYDIVRNVAIIRSPGNSTLQNQVLPIGSPSPNFRVAVVAQNLLQIIIDVLDNGTGYIPEPVTLPEFNLADPDLVQIRSDVLDDILAIQDNVILYLNSTYGGSIEVRVFPGIIHVPEGTEVKFHNVSTISTGGTTLEYVGAGVTYNALPFFGGEPIPENERIEIDNGKCFTVTNDQVGNFRVGGIFTVNALTGAVTINAEDLDLSGLSAIGPFKRGGIPVGVQLKEVSNNPLLVSSTGAPDVNTVPTQIAVREYVENNYLNKIQGTTPQTVNSDVIFTRDVAVNGGDLTTTNETFNLANANATTVNAFGAATTIEIGAVTGTLIINNDKVVIDSVTSLQIPVGDISQRPTPTELGQIRYNSEISTFEGYGPGNSWGSLGGVRSVDGLTQITAESAPAASDDILRFFVADIDNVTSKLVLTLDSESLILLNDTESTDKDSGALIVEGGVGIEKNLNIGGNLDINGNVNIDGGELTVSTATFNLANANATTVNFAGDATTLEIGAATGVTNINNNLDVDGNVNIDGGELTVSTATFNLANTTATTGNLFGDADVINIGATGSAGVLTIRNDSVVLNGDLQVQGGDFTTDQTTFNLINDTATVVNFAGAATAIEIGAATGVTNINNNLDVDGNVNIDGGDLTVSTATFNLANTTATVVNAFGAATGITIGSTTGTATIRNADTVLTGDLTVNGGDINSNAVTFNILPTISTTVNAFGAASALNLGATNGITIVRNNFEVDLNTVLNGTLTVDLNTIMTGDLAVNGGDLTTSAAAFNLINANATTVNFAGAATTIEIGAATGITNINNNLDVDGDVNIDGGDLTVSTSTFNLANTTATTVNFAGAATTINIGATGSSGVVTVRNDSVILNGNLAVNGGDLTTTATTFNFVNANATTVNAFGAATAIEIGAATGITNINNNLDVDGNVNIDGGELTVSTTTFNIANTTATTVNFAGAATTINIGAVTGITEINNNLQVDLDLDVRGGDITTNQTTFNLINTTATTGNLFGAGTDITIGAVTGTTTIRNANTVVTGDLAVNGADITTVATGTSTIFNTNTTVVNAFGAATAITIGAVTGTTNIKHNLDVDGNVNIDGTNLTVSATTFNIANTTAITGNLFGAATGVNVGIDAAAASTLTYGPAITGNIFKLAGTSSGVVNYTTDVINGTVNAWTSLTGTINIGASGVVNIGSSTSAVTAVIVGGEITGNSLKIAGTTAGTVTLNSDVTTGTVNLFNNITTGTVNLAGAGNSTVNIGSTTSIVNVGELTLTTDLEVQYGGTGVSTFTTNGILFGNAADPILVTAESNSGSNAITSFGILTTDINNVPVWTDVIDGGSY